MHQEPHPLVKFFGANLIRFWQIWLDLGRQNLSKSDLIWAKFRQK